MTKGVKTPKQLYFKLSFIKCSTFQEEAAFDLPFSGIESSLPGHYSSVTTSKQPLGWVNNKVGPAYCVHFHTRKRNNNLNKNMSVSEMAHSHYHVDRNKKCERLVKRYTKHSALWPLRYKIFRIRINHKERKGGWPNSLWWSDVFTDDW